MISLQKDIYIVDLGGCISVIDRLSHPRPSLFRVCLMFRIVSGSRCIRTLGSAANRDTRPKFGVPKSSFCCESRCLSTTREKAENTSPPVESSSSKNSIAIRSENGLAKIISTIVNGSVLHFWMSAFCNVVSGDLPTRMSKR
jgi:hypothetical protein